MELLSFVSKSLQSRQFCFIVCNIIQEISDKYPVSAEQFPVLLQDRRPDAQKFRSVLTLFAACGNKVPSENETDPQKVQAEGYDILGGTWYVGAVYYKNKIVDISDNSALEDLYDAVFLAFREDGTFTFSNRSA